MSETTHTVELVPYEIMAIIEPDITGAEYKKHVATLKDMLKKRGAEITHEQEWGKRDLAYTIKKRSSGFYVVITFNGNPSKALQLEADLRITPFILRHLIVKTPANYVPLEYNWDVEPEVEVKEEQEEAAPKKEHKPTRVVAPEPEPEPEEEIAEVETVEEEEEVEEVAEAEEVEETVEEEVGEEEVEEEIAEEEPPAKKAKKDEDDKKEIVSDKVSSERLSKLDEKLEELLSSDHDLNL